MTIADPHASAPVSTERREALLASVVHVIAQRGIDGTRYQDVAEEAGVSIGTLQHYFGTRRAMILDAIAHSVAIGGAAIVDRIDGVEDPRERLRTVIAWATDGLEGREDEWKVWLEGLAAATRDPEIERTVVASYATWQSPIARAIADGAALGHYRPVGDPEEVAAIILAAIDGVALQILATRIDDGAAAGRHRLSALTDALLRPSA